MIGFKDQSQLVQSIVKDLVHAQHPRSWNLAIPPGFGDDGVTNEIVSRLHQSEEQPIVADVTSDSIPDVVCYIRSLHRQWSKCCRLPPLRENDGPSEMFDALLASLPDGRPRVQVVRNFHKVLDCLDVWFLGKLRDAEQHMGLRTFTATPVSLTELKLRWETEGHILVVSDYGDTHTQRDVDVQEEKVAVAVAEKSGIPAGIAAYLFSLTGGYPEPFAAVCSEWLREEKPQLSPNVRRQLASVGAQSLTRFVKWLDCRGKTLYRDGVIDIYQGYDVDDAYQRLLKHPWQRILMNESGLRAECVGDAAIKNAVRTAAVTDMPERMDLQYEQRATDMYRRKQYSTCRAMLGKAAYNEDSRPDLAILNANTCVMDRLYQNGVPDEDTDWRAVLRDVTTAQKIANRRGTASNRAFLISRLAEIEEMAKILVQAQGSNELRLVDALCGLRGNSSPYPKVAVTLILLKHESCSAIPGNASACQAALFLPEQIFRVWAYWKLGVNYYATPDQSDVIWNDASAHWRADRRGPLTRSALGEPFPSLLSFAFFVLAKWLRGGNDDKNNAPIADFDELESTFGLYEQLRNPKAHSYCYTTAQQRRKFFAIIDKWLECLLSACPESVTRREVLGLIEPLPLLDKHGNWVE